MSLFVRTDVVKSRVCRVGGETDIVRSIVLEYDVEVREFGRLVLEKLQRIPIGREPNNVDILKQYIIPQQQWIEYAQYLEFVIVNVGD